MSQYQSPFDPPPPPDPSTPQAMYGEPRTTSGLAVGALVCSCIFFCTCTTVIGPILGIAALATLRGRKGAGLAVSAIALGVLFTVGQVAITVVVVRPLIRMMQEMITVATAHPGEAMEAGASGDYDLFRSYFYGTGATATDEEVRAFFDALENRYGAYEAARWDEQGSTQPGFGDVVIPFDYFFDFEDQQRVGGVVTIIAADEDTGEFIMKIESIEVDGGDKPDIVFPPGTP